MAKSSMYYAHPFQENSNQDMIMENQKNKGKKGGLLGKLLLLLLVLIIIGLGGGVGFFYKQYKDSQNEIQELKDPTNYAEVQNSLATATLAKLAKIILVPQTETPTMYTVIDAEELKKTNQEFYGEVQNGDQIIIYSNKLIVFREQDNLIVNSSYFPASSLQEAANTQEQTDTTTEPSSDITE